MLEFVVRLRRPVPIRALLLGVPIALATLPATAAGGEAGRAAPNHDSPRNASTGAEDTARLEAEVAALQKRIAEIRGRNAAMISGTQTSPESAGNAIPGSTPALQPAPGAATAAGAPRDALPQETLAGYWGRLDRAVVLAAALGLLLLLLIVAFVIWSRRERLESRRAEGRNLKPDPDEQVTAPPATPEIYAAAPYFAGPDPEMSVSDLAQVTERAGVLVALDRPDEAIDMLREHIDHEPKPSGMAWLMLLDLYRQADRQPEFTEVSKRFHFEFNAETPRWEHIPPLHDPGLETFPHLIGRIRDEWATDDCRNFLEDLLYDNQGGKRIGFSLPAFRDLLLLHSMLDNYLLERQAQARADPRRREPAPLPPAPPLHLAAIWATATSVPPEYPTPLYPPDASPSGVLDLSELDTDDAASPKRS